MDQAKPLLIPAKVPWSISASVPYLTLHPTADGRPECLTFIGYFKLNDIADPEAEGANDFVEVVEDPGEFRLDSSAEGAAYRMIRITFDRGIVGRECPAAADNEVILRTNFDWRKVPGGTLLAGESADAYLERTNGYWVSTGYSPYPRFYEVSGSQWIAQLGIVESDAKHYIASGHDEYFEVIAHGWRWEAGQRA